MANVFSGLSEKLNHIFTKLTKRGTLTELEIKQAMREVRIALLEADVNLTVAKEFVQKVSEKALGQEVLKSLSPSQQVIKIVSDELTELMGSTNSKLNVANNPPQIIMMCGLQGAGKTTLTGKLALHLKSGGKKVLTVACDVYRPAAITQLKVVSEKAGVECFEEGNKNPVKIADDAVAYAKRYGFDVVLLDTAGRLHIDETLMEELKEIEKKVSPTDILLTIDSMTGQDAVNVAKTFNDTLGITGAVLTKLDGDTRGGACLSVKAVTGKPIKFVSTGEKLGDLEPFYPDRMAKRILGMGDVLSLIEKAQQAVSEEEVKELQKRMKENSFTLDDYLKQFDMIKKMGGAQDIMSMLPGLGGKFKNASVGEIDENKMLRTKAIIQSMTKRERENPQILNYSRKTRIATGSGTTIQEVNALLKQFEQTKQLMKQFKNGKRGFPFR